MSFIITDTFCILRSTYCSSQADTFCILGTYVMKLHFNIIRPSLFACAFQVILRYSLQGVVCWYICDFLYTCCTSQLSRPSGFNRGFPLAHNSVSPPVPCSQLFCQTKRSGYKLMAVPCISHLAAYYSRPEFICRPVIVGFVVDKWHSEKCVSKCLSFPIFIVAPVHCTHLCISNMI